MIVKTRPHINTAQIAIYTWGDKMQGLTLPSPKYVIQVNDWRNPQTHGPFRDRPNGLGSDVLKWMAEEPRVGILARELRRLATMHIEGQKEPYVSIGIVDHFGKWIAPAVGELVAEDLEDHFTVGIDHYAFRIQ